MQDRYYYFVGPSDLGLRHVPSCSIPFPCVFFLSMPFTPLCSTFRSQANRKLPVCLSAAFRLNPLLASFCFSKTSSLPVQSTLPMPRSAEQSSRRAAKERERHAIEAPPSCQAGLDTVKARDRRAAETPASRQARLASDWLMATLLSTSYSFAHVPAPSESWTSSSL